MHNKLKTKSAALLMQKINISKIVYFLIISANGFFYLILNTISNNQKIIILIPSKRGKVLQEVPVTL